MHKSHNRLQIPLYTHHQSAHYPHQGDARKVIKHLLPLPAGYELSHNLLRKECSLHHNMQASYQSLEWRVSNVVLFTVVSFGSALNNNNRNTMVQRQVLPDKVVPLAPSSMIGK